MPDARAGGCGALFVLAAFGVQFDAVNIVYLGLACLAAHLLVGAWPLAGPPPWRRTG